MAVTYDSNGHIVTSTSSSTSILSIKEVRLNSHWVTESNGTPLSKPYCVTRYKFEGKTGDVEITTFEPNGIIIEDALNFTVDFVRDEETDKQTMFIRRKPPVLKNAKMLEGAQQ